MAFIQEPEVQFAQKLASNEKPIRTKAIKKLRKYINVRSQKTTGGFTGDELLKLWKGLFYCLWMQDKPLLQEELSNQISTLIHSFHDIDGQFLYLESFLQTFKREWTGIDRLRMDKFFQLVRFMFRQTFELLKRRSWESSMVARFLELLIAQLLQSDSAAPSGLQFHILDLYMTELAAVGSAELTADHNLMFIEPFCKTAAKTKDRTLFRAISNSIFSTIIDQAPFAIEDLMKEVKAAEDSDSGQASEEDYEDQITEKKSKPLSKKWTGKQINGSKSNEEEEDDLLHFEDSETELPCDDDIEPVLQFDYAALADKLFKLASRNSTPSQNRQRLYKIIKVLRDLSEGIFPQDEYPEDVSTDEDDEMFGSRKRMKRRGGNMEEDEEGTPAAKTCKGKKKEASTLNKQNKDLGKDYNERADLTTNDENKKKKRRKKKKEGQGRSAGGEENADRYEQGKTVAQVQGTIKEQFSQAEELEKETEGQSSISSVKFTEAATPQAQSETRLLSQIKKQQSITVTEEASQPKPCTTDKDQSETFSEKNKKRDTSEATETEEEQQTFATTEPKMSIEANAPVSGKKKKKKSLKAELQTVWNEAQSQVNAEAEIISVNCEASGEETTMTTLETYGTIPAKKKKKGMKAERKSEGSEIYGGYSEDDAASIHYEDSGDDNTITRLEKPTDVITLARKKSKKKSFKADAQVEVEGNRNDEITSEASTHTTEVPLKKKTKRKGKQKLVQTLEASLPANENTLTPLKNKRKKNKKEPRTTVEEERVAVETPQVVNAEKLPFEITTTTPAMTKKKTPKLTAIQATEIKDETQLQVVGSMDAELSLDETEVISSRKPTKKKKRKIPVVFEFEDDEREAAAQDAALISGIAEEETVAKKKKLGNHVEEPSTPVSTKRSQKKAKTASRSASDFITFQSSTVAPTPLFCKTKGSPSTLFSKKKSQTPKSESKKVTFGLKNNKTAGNRSGCYEC
ncbi:ribosomal RNA processing protein 1 homolog B-like isoform X2 [Xiphias gladius]|uniref:ribosomal RNA processing protein 1 homolog B-like isoform X2 n=1 Tax=Xiphias gladius TaxID=8245 RepID=UPI001A999866|nr:ribosomal RNA processing protein 1 homolog B-like isoform X2 [Xiphias gladius]